MSTPSEAVPAQMRPSVCTAIEQAADGLDITGNRALRVLLHAGLSAYWSLISAAPDRRIEDFETTMQTLREGREVGAEPTVDAPAAAIFREMDAEAGVFLELCVNRSGTEWIEPVEAIVAYVVSMMHGLVLRWLADGDEETALVVLDDMVGCLAARAIDR